MAQVINSNILSLTAQRNLDKSQGALATSLERLSSGLRINSAKDDAAGLAISERFSTQIRGLNQAIRNANDGISLSQTAEGALGEVSSNLQRIRELAVQSVNATNSDTDRATLDQEVQQRLQEIDRIASQTSFNGRNVLDGSFGSALFQVGANVGETIGLDLNTSVRTSAVGGVAQSTSVDLSTVISAGSPAVTGSAATAAFDLSALLGTDFSAAASSSTATVTTGTLAQDFSTTAAQAGSATIDFSDASIGTLGSGSTITVGDVTFTLADAGDGVATTVSAGTGTTAVTISTDLVSETNDSVLAAFATIFDTEAGTNANLTGITAAFDSGTDILSFSDADAAAGTAITGAGFVATDVANAVATTVDQIAEIDRSATFTIDDGTNTAGTFTLSTNLGAASATDIATAITSGGLNDFGVSGATGSLVFTSTATGETVGAPTLTAVETSAGNGGVNGAVTVSGTQAGTDAAAISLVIGDPGDGNVTVSLAADLSAGTTADQSAALLAAITGALAGTPEFSATEDSAGSITLTDAASVAGSFTLTSDGSAVTATSSTAGVAPESEVVANSITLAANDLTFQFGDADAIAVAAATYSTVESFVDAVNTAFAGNANASLGSDNVLTITSGEAITIATAGTDAGTVFTAGETATSGSLDVANVLTVAGANEAIQRIDAALTSTSDLRSTFGAIQNRFESTIANLSGTSENLSASRSRILDADFAAETAALTRAQILQQAGISVLSQANTQPQNVLALLN